MATTREKLVFRALCVLDEAIELATAEPIKPGMGVKLALAYLWTVSRNPQRWHFVDFWQAIQDRQADAYSEVQARQQRAAGARSCFHGIARSCGYGETPAHWQAIRDAQQTGQMKLPPKKS